MQTSHFDSPQQGNFSLSALLLVTCLLLLVTGPFHAALAYLRADSALGQGKSFSHYRNHATHLVRQRHLPGQGELLFEGKPMAYVWEKAIHSQLHLNHIRMTPEAPLGWQDVISIWIGTESSYFEIKGSLEAP